MVAEAERKQSSLYFREPRILVHIKGCVALKMLVCITGVLLTKNHTVTDHAYFQMPAWKGVFWGVPNGVVLKTSNATLRWFQGNRKKKFYHESNSKFNINLKKCFYKMVKEEKTWTFEIKCDIRYATCLFNFENILILSSVFFLYFLYNIQFENMLIIAFHLK